MKKVLWLLAVMGLLSFTGCGGGDDNNSSGPVAEVSLYSATPTITGDITFNYSNAECGSYQTQQW